MTSPSVEATVRQLCQAHSSAIDAYFREMARARKQLRGGGGARATEPERVLPGVAPVVVLPSAASAVGINPQVTLSRKRSRSATPEKAAAEEAVTRTAVFFVCAEFEDGDAVMRQLEYLERRGALKVAEFQEEASGASLPANVTHVVSCVEPFCLNVLVGVARGCWVVPRAYVDALVAAPFGAWVDEAHYGFRHRDSRMLFREKTCLFIKGKMVDDGAKVTPVAKALGLCVRYWKTGSDNPPPKFCEKTSMVVIPDSSSVRSVPNCMTVRAFLDVVLPPGVVDRLAGINLPPVLEEDLFGIADDAEAVRTIALPVQEDSGEEHFTGRASGVYYGDIFHPTRGSTDGHEGSAGQSHLTPPPLTSSGWQAGAAEGHAGSANDECAARRSSAMAVVVRGPASHSAAWWQCWVRVSYYALLPTLLVLCACGEWLEALCLMW